MNVPLLGKETIKGGEIVSRILAAEGVEKVFGIVDGSYFGFYATLGKNGIDLVTPRHETSALHMAGTYARLTGKIGVCMASNGPGVANALPGVAVEQTEGNRVLLITSSRRAPIVEPDRGGTYQCFPQHEVIKAMAKFSVHVPSVDRLAEMVRRAFREAFTGRPGVVHLDVPEDVLNGAVEPNPGWFRAPEHTRQFAPVEPSAAQIQEAAKMLRAAVRPVIHAGSGIVHAGAYAQLRRVAEMLHAPITTSWAARAVIDERHELSVPMIYVDVVNQARTEADLVLVLGSRIGETDWWGKPPYWGRPGEQKTIQVDIDPTILGNVRPTELPILGDVASFLDKLATELTRGSGDLAPRRKFAETLRKAAVKRRAKLDEHLAKQGMPMHPAHVPVVAQRVFGDDAIMVADGGNTTIWASFFHEVRRPNSLVSTPKMGMLGAGCSQVVAAKVAAPSRAAYCIIGDGAMGFHMQEVETAVRNNLPVVWIVLADKQWGMVKMNQQFALKPIKTLVMGSLSPEETIKTDLGEIEWDALARAMGAHGERVADPKGLEGALRRAVASGKPAVVHVDVDPVAHMWAPELRTFKDMHGEPRG